MSGYEPGTDADRPNLEGNLDGVEKLFARRIDLIEQRNYIRQQRINNATFLDLIVAIGGILLFSWIMVKLLT